MSVGITFNDGTVLPAGLRTSSPETARPALARQLSPDSKMRADVERRRILESERKKRIFDTKTRIMGIDVEALDAQVREKQAKKEQQLQEKLCADQQMLYFSSILTLQAREAQRIRRKREKETKDFSLTYLNKEARRNYDVKDPANSLVTDYVEPGKEHLVGVSSLLTFHGEDRDHDERVRQQQFQQRQWADEQKFERALAKQRERQQEMVYDEQALQMSTFAEAIEQNRVSQLRKNTISTAEENKVLAEERARREREEKRQEDLLKEKEIDHNLHSPMLTEGRMHLIRDDPTYSHMSPLLKTGVMGKNRDGFKGLDPITKQHILDGNVSEWRSCEARKATEKQIKQTWDRHSELNRRLAVALDRQRAQNQREMGRSTQAANELLAVHQKQQQDYLYNEVYKGEITDEFFNYFGTTTR